MGTMSKEEILKILEDAKDKNSDVPMRLVRQAFEKLPEPCEDTVSRQAAIDALEKIPVCEFKKTDGLLDALVSIGQVYMALKQLPSAQPEHSPDDERKEEMSE